MMNKKELIFKEFEENYAETEQGFSMQFELQTTFVVIFAKILQPYFFNPSEEKKQYKKHSN